MAQTFSIIAAIDAEGGIGKNGQIPWQISADMKRFKEITTTVRSAGKKNVVLMGRRTWESLPEKFRPLPDRINVVISRNDSLKFPAGVYRAASLEQGLEMISSKLADEVEGAFVIGGAQVYAEALNHPGCEKVYLTRISKSFGCDTFFPKELPGFKRISESTLLRQSAFRFTFQVYTRE